MNKKWMWGFWTIVAFALVAATTLVSCPSGTGSDTGSTSATTSSTSATTTATTTTTTTTDTTTTTTTEGKSVLPAKLMVKIPSSIGLASAKSTSFAKGLRRDAASDDLAMASSAYTMLNNMVYAMKVSLSSVGLMGVLVDALIAQNNIQPSAATVQGTNVTLTQTIYDKVVSYLSGMGCKLDSSVKVGDTIPMPDFTYSTASSPYAYYIIFTESPMTLSLSWSDDDKKVKMEMTNGPSSGFVITYDADLDASAVNIVIDDPDDATGSAKFIIAMIMKADSASSASGTFIGFDFNMTLYGTSYTYAVSGYADDNGGRLDASMSAGSGLSVRTKTVSCDFDSAGTCSAATSTYATKSESANAQIEAVSAVEEDLPASTSAPAETDIVSLAGITKDTNYLVFNDNFQLGGVDVVEGTTYKFADYTELSNTASPPSNYIGYAIGTAEGQMRVTYTSSETGTANKRYVYSYTLNYDVSNNPESVVLAQFGPY